MTSIRLLLKRAMPARHGLVALVTLGLLPTGLVAAPGALPDTPLFLGTAAPPNIMFVIDDSGSMDWEVMSRDLEANGVFTGTQPDGSSPAGAGSVTHRTDCTFGGSQSFDGYIYGVKFSTNSYSATDDCDVAADTAWRFRNSDFNVLYFDPTRTYKPWAGVDRNGIPFGDMPVTAARSNPYEPSAPTMNLLTRDADGSSGNGLRYYTWSDDGDGVYEDGEQTEYLVRNQSAAVQQNFANWFSYYRSRELVAKAAYGEVIADADGIYMGMVTLNNNNSVNTPLRLMNPGVASGNKRALLDKLYRINASSGTPLRNAMKSAARYLSCDSTSLGSCPTLSVASGGECQQNFSIAMTDGFYNGSSPSVGNTDADGAGSWDGGAYADTYSDTLADIAMKYYEEDFSNIGNKVPTTAGIDENDAQHVVTYTVAFGVDGTLTAMPVDNTAAFTWPDPSASDTAKIDDLRHAAYNGRGLFLSAQNPQQLIDSLKDAISDIAKRKGSASSASFNTSTLNEDSNIYLSQFDTDRWGGNVAAYALNESTGALATSASWDAASVLNATLPASRVILTNNGGGVAFSWDVLSAAQQADLRTDPDGSLGSVDKGKARLGYLRGDRGCELNTVGTCSYGSYSSKLFRPRAGKLGDIVHSSPVYVGKPAQRWPDGSPFPGGHSSYKAGKAGRTPMLYAGANDGMLHGFRATDGQELLAYVPGAVYSGSAAAGLHYLTDPAYGHRYYVDLSPTVSDAYISGAWKTLLVGGLRGGGRGIYVLDVSDPSGFSVGDAASTVLWEFTSAHDADLGYTYSRPIVAPLPSAVDGDGVATAIDWYVIFGNGYNNSGSGKAALFMLKIEAGLDGSWSASDYVKLVTPTGNSGLGDVTVADTNGDGVADRAYAGDLSGKMWAFDLSGAPASWGFAYTDAGSGAAQPLFAAPAGQPITAAPAVVRHPSVSTSASNAPNVLVMFGTGQYLVTSDRGSSGAQSYYSVWDHGKNSVVQSDLLAQTVSGSSVRVSTDADIDFSSKDGCYFNLDGGERVIARSLVREDRVYFNTMVPSADACASDGYGWRMAVDYENCGAPTDSSLDVNRDRSVDEADKQGDDIVTGERIDSGMPLGSPGCLDDKCYDSTPEGPADGSPPVKGPSDIKELSNLPTNRLSWEEVQ